MKNFILLLLLAALPIHENKKKDCISISSISISIIYTCKYNMCNCVDVGVDLCF